MPSYVNDFSCDHEMLNSPSCVRLLYGKIRHTSGAFAQAHTSSKLRIILRYTACSGLINQQYSHIAAFTLAAALGSELVLPPAVQRDSFANYYHADKKKNEVTWTPAPLSTLLDVDSIVAIWKSKGVTVHKVDSIELVLECCGFHNSVS